MGMASVSFILLVSFIGVEGKMIVFNFLVSYISIGTL